MPYCRRWAWSLAPMSNTMPKVPKWLRSAAQGLAFWIGYQRTIYSQHEMSEGALAAQLGTLIHSHLPDAFRLRYEQPYPKFLPKGVKRIEVTQSLADMSVWGRYVPKEGRARIRPRYVIELKRASTSKQRIERDLRKLAAIAEESENIRAFLCIASEEKRHKKFIDKSGMPVQGSWPRIPVKA